VITAAVLNNIVPLADQPRQEELLDFDTTGSTQEVKIR
jgi:hypothetical protein